jgi:hypothetical protein
MKPKRGLPKQNFSYRELMGILGAIFIIVGLFVPLLRLDAPDFSGIEIRLHGNLRLLDLSTQGTAVYLMLAMLGLYLAAKQRFRWLWIVGMATLLLTFFSIYAARKAILDRRDVVLFQNPIVESVTDFLLQGVSIQWGWALFFGGALMFIAASVIRDQP